MNHPADAEILGEGKFLRLVRAGKWEYAERPIPGAVILLAVTPEDRVLFVEQYRPPVRANVIEFPAGLVGDEPDLADEPMEEAARRELVEETGYDASSLTRLYTGCSSAGMTNETATFFLAAGLTRVAAGGGVAGENLTLHEVPLAQAENWLEGQMQNGKLIDGRVYSGLYWIHRLRGQIAGIQS
jgi:ADP-ribose pyrophosphatase